MKVRMICTGTRPLLMHNVRLASPLDPHARKLKALNSKRVKTEDDRMEIARAEFEGGLYFDEEIGPYLGGASVFASLIKGAKLTKAGKKVERGVVVNNFMMPLIYDGPRTIAGLWGGGTSKFVDIRPVRVGQSKVDRCRPIFPQWAIEAELLVDPKVLEYEELREIASNAGAMEGLGDYRQMYGRYDVELHQL